MKKATEELLKNLYYDFTGFHDNWMSLGHNKKKKIDQNLVASIAQNINSMHMHLVELRTKPHLSIHGIDDLIECLIETPQGAPFVSEYTLLDAAQIFNDESQNESSLQKMLEESIKHTCPSYDLMLDHILLIKKTLEDERKKIKKKNFI